MSKRIFLIFFILVLAALLAGAYAWAFGNPLSPTHPPLPCPTNPDLTFLEPQRFSFAMQGPGRKSNGDYVDATGNVVEKGFNSRDDLARYLLTYAEGHPHGNALQGRSWKDHVNRTEYQRICSTQAGDRVLVVQSGQKCALVDADLQVAGLVVRTGGALLVAGAVTLKCNFILVESGGLMQAGSRYAASHRYDDDAKFAILLTNGPSPYETMTEVASQYGLAVYAPGITEANADQFADFTGSLSHHTSNCFGKKAVCVGFNGNLHLAGAVGPEADYRGTWDATDVSDSSARPWFGPEERLSIGSPVFRKSYPVTWLRLVGKASKGATELTLDLRDAPAGSLEQWRADAQILITGCPDQYFTKTNPLGLLPLWVDNDAGPQRAANQAANDGFGLSYASGNEVQKIASIDPGTGIVRLRSPLLFDHDASPSAPIQRPDGRSVAVDQPLHVCLLTRNILITSVLEAGRSGCNVRHTGDDVHVPGIVCNQYDGDPDKDVSTCYDNLGGSSVYCGTQPFPGADSVAGHWIFGSDGLKGCGAIHGGQCIFRYGSAVHFDAVELKYMGTPSNFGSIAQYALHFHLSGYAQSFRDYLPSRDHPRESNLHNCSIWLALSRWVTLHGTMQASISNNVGFYCLGSGYFIEDGTELLNVFEHNVGCYALPGVQNNYYNPVPIMPNVASDFGPMATFWMKNNFNYMARNVACSSPAPAIGFWLVPQPISQLRGPSTLLLGSEVLGLPGVASMGNAAGPDGLSDKRNTNTGGAVVRFSGNTACWVPADFDFPLTSRPTLCNAYNTNNTNIPLLGFMENVCYGMYMFLSVLPEQISTGPVTTVPGSQGGGYPCSSPSNVHIFGIGWQSQDNRARAQWMPANGQNSCTDRIVGIYPEPEWSPDLSKQPFDQTVQDSLEASCHTQSQSQSFRLIPFIISGCLGFGFSSFEAQAGGAMWFHQCPAWLINCALLQKSLVPVQSMPSQTCGSPSPVPNEGNNPAETQTFVSQTSSENDVAYSSVYPVFFNFLTNGAFNNPANPTLFMGDLSCFPKENWGWGARRQECNDCLANYFVDFGVAVKDILPQKLRWSDSFAPTEDLAIFDIRNQLSYKYDKGSGAFGASSVTFPKAASSVKYPYICGLTGLYTDATGNITANFVTAHFLTPQAQRTGGLVCASLANVPPCYGKNGASPRQVQGWPSSCAKLFCQ